jgi:hypothetical protein
MAKTSVTIRLGRETRAQIAALQAALSDPVDYSQADVIALAVAQLHANLTGVMRPASQLALERLKMRQPGLSPLADDDE